MQFKLLAIILSLFVMVSCGDDEQKKSNEKEIVAFSVGGQVGDAIINAEMGEILIYIDTVTSISEVIPTIEVSAGATVTPASKTMVNFTNSPVIFTVTAEDNSSIQWKVTVETVKNGDAKILSFYHKRQNSVAIIGDSTVFLEMKIGSDLSNIAPTITISPNASITPLSEESVDFSQGEVIYTVTAENGEQKLWYVTVELPKEYAADILTYSIPDQIGESVFKGSSIYVEVAKGYDLTSVIPTFTISEGTTVIPAQGEAVDFSKGYVDFKVTTEVDSKKVWRVYVSEYMFKATHDYIQYMGRIDFTDSTRPMFSAPGTSVFTKFSGTYCDIIINDLSTNYFEVVIDGTQAIRLESPGGYTTLKVVKDLADGEHTLTLTKNTEVNIGSFEFVGLRCDALLKPDDMPSRKMEFIGNSITCGTGSDISEIACGAGEWKDQHNAYFAYGPETARRLDAQWMLSSYSGIGMIHSCCDIAFQIDDIYEKINLKPSGDDWDFSRYQADVVTICLGQNDGILDSVKFCSAYVNFIGTIRSHYPDADIICITSPMADIALRASQESYLTGIYNYMLANGDSKVHKFFFSQGWNSGCDTHPDLDEHQLIADELEAFIKSELGW